MYNKLDISDSSFLYTVLYNLWLNGTPYFFSPTSSNPQQNG